MSRSWVSLAVVVCLAVVATAAPAWSQSAHRVGVELQVNSYTTGSQLNPAIVIEGDGDFVVTWDAAQPGSREILARRFSSAGVRLGAEFLVNSELPNYQTSPAAAVDAEGDFVVVWQAFGQDGAYYGIFAKRFSSAGFTQGGEFQINLTGAGDQRYPAVAMAPSGEFVVAWQAPDAGFYGVFARRFNAAGIAVGADFAVNSFTTNNQTLPTVAMNAGGGFVVAWSSLTQDGDSYGVFARRFNAAGSAQATEFQVNIYTTSSQARPSVAMSSGGDFAVAWQSHNQDSSLSGVFGRRFNAAGVAQGGEFQVNAFTPYEQILSSVAMDGGTFVVAWASLNPGEGYGVFARRFNSSGTALGGDLVVSTYVEGDQTDPAVAMNGAGDFVVAWESPQDGSEQGIFAQRFVAPAILDIDANGSIGPLTDGLLVLRFLFGFTGSTLISGAVDLAGCTRCDAGSIQTYLQTLI